MCLIFIYFSNYVWRSLFSMCLSFWRVVTVFRKLISRNFKSNILKSIFLYTDESKSLSTLWPNKYISPEHLTKNLLIVEELKVFPAKSSTKHLQTSFVTLSRHYEVEFYYRLLNKKTNVKDITIWMLYRLCFQYTTKTNRSKNWSEHERKIINPYFLALQYRPKGRRNTGRPRKRWRDQLHLED